MIIDAKTVIVTLFIVALAAYAGLQFIRSFALSIAQENHDANLAMDMTEEARRAKRELDADVAATAAFAKVEPLLPASVISKGLSVSGGAGASGGGGSDAVYAQPSAREASTAGARATPPSSGGVPAVALAQTKFPANTTEAAKNIAENLKSKTSQSLNMGESKEGTELMEASSIV